MSDDFTFQYESGSAYVTATGEHGAYACSRQSFDACEDTQELALMEVEKQLLEALEDVRALLVVVKRKGVP